MNDSSRLLVPSHLAETLRYRQYKWRKTASLQRLAMQVATGERDNVGFLNSPLEALESGHEIGL